VASEDRVDELVDSGAHHDWVLAWVGQTGSWSVILENLEQEDAREEVDAALQARLDRERVVQCWPSLSARHRRTYQDTGDNVLNGHAVVGLHGEQDRVVDEASNVLRVLEDQAPGHMVLAHISVTIIIWTKPLHMNIGDDEGLDPVGDMVDTTAEPLGIPGAFFAEDIVGDRASRGGHLCRTEKNKDKHWSGFKATYYDETDFCFVLGRACKSWLRVLELETLVRICSM
jgi:hypothetical protein